MAGGALDDLKVLDLARGVAGSYCARLFADFGADVVKVEPPAGSPLRGRLRGALPVAGPLFLWADANKRGLTLDLETEAGRATLAQLAGAADVLIEDFEPGERRDDGLVRALMAANPRLVVITITPFGLTGPDAQRRASTLTLNALTGFSWMNIAGERPHPEPGEHIHTQAGIAAYITATAALLTRRRTGRGQRADLSEQEIGLTVLLPAVTRALLGQPVGHLGDTLVPCKDGWVSIYAVQDRAWEALRIVMGLEAYADDARFATPVLRQQHATELRGLMLEAAASLSRWEIFEQLSVLRSICGMVLEPGEVLRDPHLAERCFFRQIEGDPAGAVLYPGAPFRGSGTPFTLVLPAPSIGEHRDAVLAEWLGRKPATPERPAGAHGRKEGVIPGRTGGPAALDALSPDAPLYGVRIADLSGAWAGSFASQILGDLGAEVIKIEALKRPDVWRGGLGIYQFGFGEPGNRPYNRNGLINSVNRNKLGITLDLGTPDGRELFLQLVASSDVVAENFTPRVMGNFGLDFATLAAVRPGLIMLSMPAYGDSGPYSDFAGIGGTIEPMSGNSSLFVGPEDRPLNSGDMYPDAVAGLFGAAAVLTALYARERSPEAQYINLAQLEAMVALVGGQMVEASLRGSASRWDDADPELAPSGHFQCSDGAWLAITATDAADRLLLAQLCGEPQLAGEDLDGLTAALRGWCLKHDGGAAERMLVEAGVPAALVRPPFEYARSDQAAERGFLRTMPHTELGSITTAGVPWLLSETPGTVRLGPPCLGEHSEQVLRDLLGLAKERIDALAEARVTGTSPPE